MFSAFLIFCHLLVMASVHTASYLSHNTIRLYLNFSIAWAILPATLFCPPPFPGKKWAHLLNYFFLALAVLGFAVSLHKSAGGKAFADSGSARGYRLSRDFLKDKPLEKILVVSGYPTHFAILPTSSINFDTYRLNKNKVALELIENRWSAVYIFQTIPEGSADPDPAERVEAGDLATLAEHRISKRNSLRISELKRK